MCHYALGNWALTPAVRNLSIIFSLNNLRVLHSLVQVTKVDVDAALKVLNFAIYHKELAEMEEREHEREKELQKKQKADRAAGNNRAARGDAASTEG